MTRRSRYLAAEVQRMEGTLSRGDPRARFVKWSSGALLGGG